MEINNFNSHTSKSTSFPYKTNIERNSHYFTYTNSKFDQEKNKDILLKTSLATLACLGMVGCFRAFDKPNNEIDFDIPDIQINEANISQEKRYDEALNQILSEAEQEIVKDEPFADEDIDLILAQEEAINLRQDEILSVDEIMKRNQKICKWIDFKTQDGFYDKCIIISRELNCDPNDLVSIIYSQSAFNPSAENNWHVGLIQLNSAALGEIGYNYWDVKYMSPLKQLDVIGKYLKQAKAANFDSDMKLSAADLYSLILFPDSISKQVFCSSKDDIYQNNSKLDYNSDGYITKTDLNNIIQESFGKICECAKAN